MNRMTSQDSASHAAHVPGRPAGPGWRRTLARLGLQLLLVSSAGLAAAQQPASREDCERNYKPSVGQSGKDVIWVPTPDALVTRMFEMAKVTPQDTVVDLGAGDGKIAIAAGKLGANAVGIEYNADMAKLADCLVQVEGARGKTRIVQGDIFKEDFSHASVLTMYLLPELNLCVRHRILAMRPGTRVTAHQFNMGEWTPDETSHVEHRMAHLWIVPARAGGSWSVRGFGTGTARLELAQDFQMIGGELRQGDARRPLIGARLHGDELRFAIQDADGVTRNFTGKITGKRLAGDLTTLDGSRTEVTGTLQSRPRAVAWAEMAPNCKRFYAK
ncbi:class I SAM-dependent methyltransferase [Ramlibacter sp.]|uniref:class I SAM-dependent methyltransferase n=1 Tax=Ramlibacter sp. TaxID=1917967 RepID=UPI003D11C939